MYSKIVEEERSNHTGALSLPLRFTSGFGRFVFSGLGFLNIVWFITLRIMDSLCHSMFDLYDYKKK